MQPFWVHILYGMPGILVMVWVVINVITNDLEYFRKRKLQSVPHNARFE